MKIRVMIAAAVSMLACAGAFADDAHKVLGNYQFGKKADEIKKSLANVETVDACTTSALRKLYSDNGVSCDVLVAHDPAKIGEILFYPEYAFTKWGDRLVAVVYRSAHRFASKKKRDLEMGSEDLVAAAADRDYMIARTNTFRSLGDISKPTGRQQITLRPGLRVIKYYFSGEQVDYVFREHMTEAEDRITLVAIPKAFEDGRRVFLSDSEDKRFFGHN